MDKKNCVEIPEIFVKKVWYSEPLTEVYELSGAADRVANALKT